MKIDGGDRSFRGLKFVVWYLSKVWRYLLASFRVLSENISELIFKKVATEIEHILRLSKLKEYASH